MDMSLERLHKFFVGRSCRSLQPQSSIKFRRSANSLALIFRVVVFAGGMPLLAWPAVRLNTIALNGNPRYLHKEAFTGETLTRIVAWPWSDWADWLL